MKKFLAGIAAAAIITVPMTSFALESMSKGALKKATGQAGVSIALDNVVIYMKSQPTTTYWDADGTSVFQTGSQSHTHVGTVTNAGIEISYDDAAQKLITLGAIIDASQYGVADLTGAHGIFKDAADIGILDASTAATTNSIDITTGDIMDELATPAAGTTAAVAGNANPANGKFMGGISPLTIDVGTCQALSQGFAYNKNYMTSASRATAAASYGAAVSAYNTEKTQYDTVMANTAATEAERTTAKEELAAASAAVRNVEMLSAATSNDAINASANIAGVVIGLPTIEINQYHTKDVKHIKLVTQTDLTATAGAVNEGKEFIAIEKSGKSTMAILGGRIEIAPH